MWAPDVHNIKSSSALLQLATAFGLVGLFAFGMAEMRPDAPAVRTDSCARPCELG